MRVKIYNSVSNVRVDGKDFRVSVPHCPNYNVSCDHSGLSITIDSQPDLVVRYTAKSEYVLRERSTTRVVTSLVQGPVGPRGPLGPPGIGDDAVTQINVGPIYATESAVIDSLDLTTWRSAKWIVTITDAVSGTFKVSEVLGLHRDGESSFSHYGMIGDAISCRVQVKVSAGNLELEVENTHPNAIHVSAVRIPTYKYPT